MDQYNRLEKSGGTMGKRSIFVLGLLVAARAIGGPIALEGSKFKHITFDGIPQTEYSFAIEIH